jgi:hypothetical protein
MLRLSIGDAFRTVFMVCIPAGLHCCILLPLHRGPKQDEENVVQLLLLAQPCSYFVVVTTAVSLHKGGATAPFLFCCRSTASVAAHMTCATAPFPSADTSIKGKSPQHLASLAPLTQLTQLHLGGLEVADADIAHNISTFSCLRDLDLWGSSISTQGERGRGSSNKGLIVSR